MYCPLTFKGTLFFQQTNCLSGSCLLFCNPTSLKTANFEDGRVVLGFASLKTGIFVDEKVVFL